MLPVLQAERQLLAIEAAMFAAPDPTGRLAHHRSAVIDRLMRTVRGEKRARSAVEAFAAAGIRVVHVPTKRRRKRRDEVGRDQGVKRGR